MSTVAVLLLAARSSAPPSVVEGGPARRPDPHPTELATAMAEDVFTVLGLLEGVAVAVAFTPAWAGVARALVWPDTALLPLAGPAPGGPTPGDAALAALGGRGVRRAVLVAPDAPDLPALHLAKVLRALDSAPVAVVPAHGGGLVALATRVPSTLGQVDLDGPAPPGALAPLAWRRCRDGAGTDRLDDGLEGWESTRTLLGR